MPTIRVWRRLPRHWRTYSFGRGSTHRRTRSRARRCALGVPPSATRIRTLPRVCGSSPALPCTWATWRAPRPTSSKRSPFVAPRTVAARFRHGRRARTAQRDPVAARRRRRCRASAPRGRRGCASGVPRPASRAVWRHAAARRPCWIERPEGRVEAESLAQAAVRESRAAFGDAHPETAASMQQLGFMLVRAWARRRRASAWSARHWRSSSASGARRTPWSRRTMSRTGSGAHARRLLGRGGAAPRAKRPAIEAASLGTKHSVYAGTLTYLADVIALRGALDSAETLCRRAHRDPNRVVRSRSDDHGVDRGGAGRRADEAAPVRRGRLDLSVVPGGAPPPHDRVPTSTCAARTRAWPRSTRPGESPTRRRCSGGSLSQHDRPRAEDPQPRSVARRGNERAQTA